MNITNKPYKEGEEPKTITQIIVELEEKIKEFKNREAKTYETELVINAFLAGQRVVKKIGIGFLKKEKRYITTDRPDEQLLSDLLIHPERWEIYQEPKKAWIYTNDFVAKEFPILNDNSRSGAIALARELVKRLKQNHCFNETSTIYQMLVDLVGAENL